MTVIILRMIRGMTVVVMVMMIYYDGDMLVYTNHSNVQCLCNCFQIYNVVSSLQHDLTDHNINLLDHE